MFESFPGKLALKFAVLLNQRDSKTMDIRGLLQGIADAYDRKIYGEPLREKEAGIRLLEEQVRKLREGRGV